LVNDERPLQNVAAIGPQIEKLPSMETVKREVHDNLFNNLFYMSLITTKS